MKIKKRFIVIFFTWVIIFTFFIILKYLPTSHISQTKVWNEQIGDTKKGWGWLADFYDDNYLVVNTYDIDGNIKNKKIKNDKAAIYLVDKLEAEKDEEYQNSLADMENWSFLNEAIVSSGENFIKVIFAPAYATIEFVEEAQPGEEFVQLNQYLENEINNGERQSKELEKALYEVKNAESSL